MTDDELWTRLEVLGRVSGHLVAQCPRCGSRQMIAYHPPSQQSPYCKVCQPGSLTAGTKGLVRVEVIGDRNLVTNKRPGQPRTDAQLKRAGLRRPRPEGTHETTDRSSGRGRPDELHRHRPTQGSTGFTVGGHHPALNDPAHDPDSGGAGAGSAAHDDHSTDTRSRTDSAVEGADD